MTGPSDPIPDAVSDGQSIRPRTRPDGQVRTRWAWTEPTVWTDRMLTALEQGVQGGKWFCLMDKVYAEANLAAAYGEVAANEGAAGVDHVTIDAFGHHLEEELQRLAQRLRTRTYRPQAVRRVWIPKPGRGGKRPLRSGYWKGSASGPRNRGVPKER